MKKKNMKISLILYGLIIYLIYDVLLKKKNVNSDYEDYINIGKGQTYPDYRYKEFADILFYAMDNPGTDEEAVLGVFRKMRTSDDVRKLKEVFGTPGYSGGINSSIGAWLNPDVSLSGWLSLEGMTQSVNAVLNSKGIKERV